MNKIALFDLSQDNPDLWRFKKLTNKLNLTLIDNSAFNENSQNIDILLISDYESIRLYKKILKIKKIKKIYLLNLELYSLDLYSLISDHLINNFLSYSSNKRYFQYIKSLIVFFIRLKKLMLIRKIIKRSSSVILIPSIPRIKYLDKKNSFQKILIRNLPLRSQMLIEEKIKKKSKKKNFIYLSGNINNFDEFIEICNFAVKNKFKFFVSTNNPVPEKIINMYNDTLTLTGVVSNKEALSYVRDCEIAIALYNKKTKNSELCASSKLFEYMCLGKNIIASRVEGIQFEADYFNYNKITYVDELNQNKTYNSSKAFESALDERLIYENQLLKLNF